VGGTLGALLTGIFASTEANSNLATNLGDVVGKTLWLEQLKAIGLTMAIAIPATVVLAYGIKAIIGLRPDREGEEAGLDATDHGESGYHHDEIYSGSLETEHAGAPAHVKAPAEAL
jgi:Amt family ammonium transporter